MCAPLSLHLHFTSPRLLLLPPLSITPACLFRYFADDHNRKVKVLEEQRTKVESELALKKELISHAQEMKKVCCGAGALLRRAVGSEEGHFKCSGGRRTSLSRMSR